ncbi:tRNA pseudouridine(38-40) synthase TruA [Candidatus Omnitrophota bacterium]
MRNIKLTITYDGTDYRGWQVQKNGQTVQEEMERAVKKVFGKRHRIYGASRTDAGVHAEQQVANFKVSSNIPIKSVQPALNAALPENIVVTGAEEVPVDFNSRFDAKSKLYRYRIINKKHRDPFAEKYSWRVSYQLDVPLMKKEAACLIGKHDFKSFQASDKRERASVRRILSVDIKKNKEDITIDIKGDGFLYNMVRNIVGTLVDIGRGYLPPGSMKTVLKNKDRTKAGPTAPAKGLYLINVNY